MKTIRTVAHVGAHKKRTPGDTLRQIEALNWMMDNGFPVELNSKSHDVVNLEYGRDFLIETNHYDCVILHFVFRGGFRVPLQNKGQLSTSPESSWSAWRHRLAATQAQLIFAFGGETEIGGTFLVDVPGYKVHKVRTDPLGSAFDTGRSQTLCGLWVFEKT